MTRPKLEVADVFRRFGPAWRAANEGHLSLGAAARHERRSSSAAPRRSAATSSAAPTARTRGSPTTPAATGTAPSASGGRPRPGSRRARRSCCRSPTSTSCSPCRPALGGIAYQNKARVYGLLLKAAAEALTTIAADPKHLGARIGVTAVLHTWGQTLDHHPHVHCIVPAGGISPRRQPLGRLPAGLLPAGAGALAPVPAAVPRRPRRGARARARSRLFGDLAGLREPGAFRAHLAAQRRREWVVYAKAPFAGPKQVLGYLARYTHRVAISNRRLVALDDDGQVSFRWKDYRASGRTKPKVMRLPAGRVHAPLPAARAPGRVPPHPPLRAARQRPPGGDARALPRAAGRAARPGRGRWRRGPRRSGVARRRRCRPARAAAGRC